MERLEMIIMAIDILAASLYTWELLSSLINSNNHTSLFATRILSQLAFLDSRWVRFIAGHFFPISYEWKLFYKSCYQTFCSSLSWNGCWTMITLTVYYCKIVVIMDHVKKKTRPIWKVIEKFGVGNICHQLITLIFFWNSKVVCR